MMNARTKLFSVLGLSLAVFAAGAASLAGDDKKDVKGAKIGEAAPAWTLKDIKGTEWKSTDQAGKIVVLEWVNPQCPVCKGAHKDGRIPSMVKELKELGAMHIAINSSHSTSAEENEKALEAYGVEYPVLLDLDGTVGKAYGARTTPHLFVIDTQGVLRYHGALDNNARGDKSGADVTNYAINAVKQIKAGETVTPDYVQSYGCSVKYKAQGKPEEKKKDNTKSME
jgi:peroxiredoxin